MLKPTFTSTDLQRSTKAVYDAVESEPVIIRRNGHEDMILMTKWEYLKLLKGKHR